MSIADSKQNITNLDIKDKANIKVKTRFAPSPTGFLHIGGARTALFAYAFAKRYCGEFILRIEDSDHARSTSASVDSILDAMQWLKLDYDVGPIYQSDRLARYSEVVQTLLDSGHAYYCACSQDELNEMRDTQKQSGLKPKYDRRCLAKQLHIKQNLHNTKHVIRFKNPDENSVTWHDLVKGRIEIHNNELDDLVIVRSDGAPTYNLCVVVDDLDMQITHVVRGDDHVNNTPRQINIFKALNQAIPMFAHLPMILREDGQKMSKRYDAVSVMQYKEMGILPDALLNYLSRLCWGHGNDEVFTMQQFLAWFSLDNVSSSPARFDIKKLFWINQEHIKLTDNLSLFNIFKQDFIAKLDHSNSSLSFKEDSHELRHLLLIIENLKSRSNNMNQLITECLYFYNLPSINLEDREKYLNDATQQIINTFITKIKTITEWTLDNLKLIIKDFCTSNNIKMPQLGVPLRLLLCGNTSAPSVDLIMFLLGQDNTLNRIQSLIICNDDNLKC